MALNQTFKRLHLQVLERRLSERRRFIQALLGPRQVGKTTLARQAAATFSGRVHTASADLAEPTSRTWIQTQWQTARALSQSEKTLLILDEIQKIPDWSSAVKALWDEDSANGAEIHVLLLGSSPMLVQRGLSESLAGRFEVIHVPHWSYSEMREAFGYTLEQFIYFGGYPGAASLVDDEERWRSYVANSLIETTVSRDILLMTRVDKPSLLRRLFSLACEYSGQILSYQKIVGQLQDAGNTTTVAHYLDLLHGAGFVTGLQKYSGQTVRQRASSPKLQVLNTGLMSAICASSFEATMADHKLWGHLVESAVGAHLLNSFVGSAWQTMYWNESAREVDFVVTDSSQLYAIEVKSQASVARLPGMDRFCAIYPQAKPILVGGSGIPLDTFLMNHPDQLLR